MSEKASIKLLELMAEGLGKIYEPLHKKRMAKATAYEIKTISEALKQSSDLPIRYSAGDFSIDTSDYEQLIKRAGSRLGYQEVCKQENLEAVFEKALLETGEKETTAAETVSREWIFRFIDMASEISSEEIQNIWAKVLAGEVIEPNSFSIKTLECLRCLSKRDAELFERVCKLVISGQLIYADTALNNEYGISYDELLELDEDGLIKADGMILLSEKLNEDPKLFLDFGDYVLLVSKETTEGNAIVEISHFPLTRAGRELYSIASTCWPDKEYTFAVVSDIKESRPGICFSLRKVLSREGSNIEYESCDTPFCKDE